VINKNSKICRYKQAIESGSLKIGDSIDIEMKLTLKDQNIDHVISDKLTIE